MGLGGGGGGGGGGGSPSEVAESINRGSSISTVNRWDELLRGFLGCLCLRLKSSNIMPLSCSKNLRIALSCDRNDSGPSTGSGGFENRGGKRNTRGWKSAGLVCPVASLGQLYDRAP